MHEELKLVPIVTEDFSTLVQLMKEDAGEEPFVNESFHRSLMIHSGKNHLYLKSGVNGFLIISNVTVQHRGQGNFTRMYDWITRYAKEKGYAGIVVESVLSEEMRGFVERRGFAPTGAGWNAANEPFIGDWKLVF